MRYGRRSTAYHRRGALRRGAVAATCALVSVSALADAPAERILPPGCSPVRRAAAHRPGGEAVNGGGDRPIVCALPTGFPAEEATIGITSDGTVFYSPTVDFRDPFASVGLARSADEGATWQRIVPKPAGLPAHFPGDPYVYVDPRTSRVFFVTLAQPAQCGSVVSRSDDRGLTWETSLVGCPLFDHETLFAGPPVTSSPTGYPNVVYYCAVSPILTQGPAAGCMKSLDGGRTFTPTGEFAYVPDPTAPGRGGLPGTCDALTGHGTVGPDGTVYLPKGLCGQPYLAISHNEGATWQRVQVSDLGMPFSNGYDEHEAGIAVDADGNLYYAWVAADRLPYLTTSRDGGLHWSSPIMIGAPGVREASIAQVAVGSPGRVAVVYLGSTNSPGPPFEGGCRPNVLLCLEQPGYEDVTFDGYVTVTADALGSDPLLFSAPVNDPADPLLLGCAPPACNDDNTTRVDYVDVEVGPDGTPWGAFVDGCTGPCVEARDRETPLVGLVGRLVGGPNLRD